MKRTTFSHPLGAGAAATAVLTGTMIMSNKMGLIDMHFDRILGTMFAPDSPRTRAAGWTMHAFNGIAFAFGYRELFQRSGIEPSWKTGAAAGLGHALLSMAVMAAWPLFHPRPQQAGFRAFGPFAYGPMTLPGMLMGHIMYGAIVGHYLGSRTELNGRAWQRWREPDVLHAQDRARFHNANRSAAGVAS